MWCATDLIHPHFTNSLFRTYILHTCISIRYSIFHWFCKGCVPWVDTLRIGSSHCRIVNTLAKTSILFESYCQMLNSESVNIILKCSENFFWPNFWRCLGKSKKKIVPWVDTHKINTKNDFEIRKHIMFSIFIQYLFIPYVRMLFGWEKNFMCQKKWEK